MIAGTREVVATPAVRAGLIAAIVSGAPSTVHSLLTGRDPLEASRAAGAIVLPRERRALVLVLAALPVHLALSIGWAVALSRFLSRPGVWWRGPLAGATIAAVDLGLVGRRVSAIRALPVVPQLADHVAYATTVAAVLRHGRRAAHRPG